MLKKTQVLCIHDNKFNNITSYIRANDEDINSTEHLKILGFFFDRNPNATYHVTQVIGKFYNKLWTLRFLKKSGMSPDNLLKVYKSVLLPSVEYCSVVYGSLIPDYLSKKLEQVQKQAVKIMFGWGVDYGKLLEDGIIEALEDRRRKDTLKFANKALMDPRFGERWFPRNEVNREARESTRRPFKEKMARTERTKNNPIEYMIRLLNEQSSIRHI